MPQIVYWLSEAVDKENQRRLRLLTSILVLPPPPQQRYEQSAAPRRQGYKTVAQILCDDDERITLQHNTSAVQSIIELYIMMSCDVRTLYVRLVKLYGRHQQQHAYLCLTCCCCVSQIDFTTITNSCLVIYSADDSSSSRDEIFVAA